MLVNVRCFAVLRELAAGRVDLELPPATTVAGAWEALAAQFPAIASHRPYVRAARNAAYAEWETPLADGDQIAFMPPVSGGMGRSGLVEGSIQVADLEAAVASLGHGALITFVGRARDRADDGRTVLELEYEAFPDMAGVVLAEIVAEAEGRWPGCAVGVVHRVGVVPLGEAAVVIAVAAPHRAEAYEANRYVIEAVKQRLPIWKRERFADGSEWKRPGA